MLEHEAGLTHSRLAKFSSPGAAQTPGKNSVRSPASPSAKTPGPSGAVSTGAIYEKMKTLGTWMAMHNLPRDKKSLMPLAANGLMSVELIAAAVEKHETEKLAKGFRKFTDDDRERCQNLARAQASGASGRLDAENWAKVRPVWLSQILPHVRSHARPDTSFLYL